MTHGFVHQINVSAGGVPKLPVGGPVEVGADGLAGDAHNDARHHGGPHRALCIYSLEVIEALRREGHPIRPGYAGENLTIAGLDWEELAPGRRLLIGRNVVAELTATVTPCAKNAAWFVDGYFRRMDADVHPGWSRWYARVVAQGAVEQGDPVGLETSADDGGMSK